MPASLAIFNVTLCFVNSTDNGKLRKTFLVLIKDFLPLQSAAKLGNEISEFHLLVGVMELGN